MSRVNGHCVETHVGDWAIIIFLPILFVRELSKISYTADSFHSS